MVFEKTILSQHLSRDLCIIEYCGQPFLSRNAHAVLQLKEVISKCANGKATSKATLLTSRFSVSCNGR